jgi:hypothetical protein
MVKWTNILEVTGAAVPCNPRSPIIGRFINLIYRQEGMTPWAWNLLIHMWKETYMQL